MRSEPVDRDLGHRESRARLRGKLPVRRSITSSVRDVIPMQYSSEADALRTRAPSRVLLVSILCASCGARVAIPEAVDVTNDNGSELMEASVDVADAIDMIALPDVQVIPCDGGHACADGIPACRTGHVRCGSIGPECAVTGMASAGTACVGGACNASGDCVQSGAQFGCISADTPGCGTVAVTAGTEAVGEPLSFQGHPVMPAITTSPFVLDAYEVTVARFRAYWDAGHPAPGDVITYRGGRTVPWLGPVREPGTGLYCTWSPREGTHEEQPLNCVDYWTAQAFCVWDGGRLPTEAEWEYAARGRTLPGIPTPRTYPWGNEEATPDCDRARWNDTRCPGDDGLRTRRVGSFAPSGGLYDLAGNVWEWTADNFLPYSYTRCWGPSPQVDPLCVTVPTQFRVVRGGSWHGVDDIYLSSASRVAITPDYRDFSGGMRCAR